jgi:hypothetical protein
MTPWLSRVLRMVLVLASVTVLAGFSFSAPPAVEPPPPEPVREEVLPPSPTSAVAPAIPPVPTITPPPPSPRTGPLRRLGQRVRLLLRRDRKP